MNQTNYFNRIGYRAKYSLGDRVIGNYKGIPFRGRVGNDHLVSEDTGPEVTVHLYLPMLVDGGYRTVIAVKHENIKESTYV